MIKMINNSHTGTSFGIRITKKQVDIAFFYCIIFVPYFGVSLNELLPKIKQLILEFY